MSDIDAIAPAKTISSVDGHQPPARDGRKTARRPQPRRPPSDDEMVEAEPHTLDLEA